ncbi:MAG: D-cysteine desulfhydrase family protein [Clostridia bacterium]
MRDITDFNRVRLGQLPTPLYKLNNLSRELNKNIYIKRDDMTGVSLGGNKVRKLEFLLADAIAQGCDTVITTGGAQSNHAMLTAACCNMLGLSAVLVLKGRGVMEKKGNLVLDDLLGAPVQMVDSDDYADVYAQMDDVAKQLKAQGRKPYIVPVGGSTPLGALGYVECVREIAEQTKAMGVELDHIICCTGSGGTQAGLALGAALYTKARVTGIAVSDDDFEAIVEGLCMQTARILETDARAAVHVEYCFGEGYAIPSNEGCAAIRYMAKTEGLIFDPVYTGKAFAGLLELNRNGRFDGEKNILMLHSGGAGGVFAIDVR